MDNMIVLAGDIGGTKTNLGVFDVSNQQVHSVFESTWGSADFQSLEMIIKQFLENYIQQGGDGKLVTTACFGVAGPVIHNHCEVTNLPWVIDGDAIAQKFGWRKVQLLNDLEANAWGIPTLSEEDFVCLNKGHQQTGNASIIAAGTGLGEAGLFWNGVQHVPFASEGGHADFSPMTEQEFRLYEFLSKKYDGHVSWERIVSGMGLENLYQFLCYDNAVQTPSWLVQQMEQDAAAAIASAAQSGRDNLCEQALNWFVYLYGVEAGNHALKILSRGGVYLGGGIAPKIIKQLQSGAFMDAFVAKGRMQPLLEAMPVKVIMNDKTALYGPAFYAGSKQLN